jgi:carboxypeptidase Taq
VAESLSKLKERLAEITSLYQINALLDWDLQTQLPRGASESRARHLSTLTKLTHEMFTADETGQLIEAASQETADAAYDSDDASLLRVARRDYERDRKLPSDLVAETSRVTAMAHEIWRKARAENDFKSFAPSLQRIVELKKQAAECYGYTDHIYDALLDGFEPGMKTADVVAMFSDLRKELVPLARAIGERVNAVDDSMLHQAFDEDRQRQFGEMVIRRFGYDFTRGRQDRSAHPFTTNFSRDDVRITTRFDHDWLNPALFGTLHEAGHAMYEQGVAPELEGTFLSGGTSLGVHESQSRLWENLVGRSRGFWVYFYPILQTFFPDQFDSVTPEAFYRAINRVEPSFIRVEADEVTYNLHVLIRFELEVDLLTDKIKVADLPQAWNAKSKEYLGIVPPTDTLGVLQDVHWSGGSVGYFSTYSIGNLLSAQLFEKAVEQHPSIPDEMARGEFETLLNWMRENVHKHGRKYEPPELVKRVTGEPMSSRAYMRYLKAKFGEIYGL